MPSIAFAEPDMSYHDSSDDSIRRLTDDYGRHRLTDSSAVLTEDTDSFIIGQRVWVGGTKPGTIAYIGETQFAPGDWAGIALDEPIGKNDGSVAGTRYFQCENKKGVFSRLTRLTRVPLEQPGMGSGDTFANNGVRRSPISPTGSTKSLLKSPTLSNSNTSLASSHVDFKIGDRVIIKSTQGSKVGTVRYMGLTDFAPGEWVGVELDDPRGKNDGSVEGKRYFECRPRFGLFAPISKVSKSPSKYKPGACVVHSGPGLPPSGLKKTNSKESLNSSIASSVRRVRLGVTSLTPKKTAVKTTTPLPTRTALQDVLREKQQHIEQLLKERDLERAEITRAASQADEAEQKLFDLKREFEQYRSQCEIKARENSDLLAQLKVDRTELLNQLEEEKRRNEDLQFRFEEAAITKGDIEATNEQNIRKIIELETRLASERDKAENAESVSNRLFEAEENLIKAREEIETLRNELEASRKKGEESCKQNAKLNEEISKISSDHEAVKLQAEAECEKQNAENEKLKGTVAEKSTVIEKLQQANTDLTKENDKLKMELSAKSLDLETAHDTLALKQAEFDSAQSNKDSAHGELTQKIAELERHKQNQAEIEDNLRKELEETRKNLRLRLEEMQNVTKDFSLQVTQKDSILEDANKSLAQKSEEIKKLQEELATTKRQFEESQKEIDSKHTKKVSEQHAQLTALSSEMQQKNEEVTKLNITVQKLEEDLCNKNSVIEKLRLDDEKYQTEQSSRTEAFAVLEEKLRNSELRNSELQRELQMTTERLNGLSQTNQRLEGEIQSLMANSRSEHMAQLEQLRGEVHAKEQQLEAVRSEFMEKIGLLEKDKQEIQFKLDQSVAQFVQVKAQLEETLQDSLRREEELKQTFQSSSEQSAKLADDFKFRSEEIARKLQDKEHEIAGLHGKCADIERSYQEQMQSMTAQLSGNLDEAQAQVASLTNEVTELRKSLAEKAEEVIEANSKSSYAQAQLQQTENELKQQLGEEIKKLQFELNEKNVLLDRTQAEVGLLKQDCQNVNVDLAGKNQQISELIAEEQRAQQLVNRLQVELSELRSAQQQTSQEREQAESQQKSFLERIAALTEKVKTGEDMYKKLENEHNNFLQVLNQLKITEGQKQECLMQLQGGEGCRRIEEFVSQVKTEVDRNAEKVIILQGEIESLKDQITSKNQQMEAQKGEVLRLQELLLQARDSGGRPGTRDESLVEDKELAENQIKFLNSIIVDIQKKNEEQKARIEILEKGYSPAMADELKLIGLTQHQPAPRVYCDICEEFDLHETEDCPEQDTDLAPNRTGRALQERPYCELCEQFGHSTEDCQEDDQTF